MVNAFDDAFTAAKRARNAADFNDLEHFAVRLLYTDGKPSALAKTMSEQFTEIAVDEYQDTNAVQDAIFRALSRDETNLFMVGDVKQSIYGFRLADPSIFLEKYRSFGEAADAADGQPRRVVLGQNFRSRAAVLDACNYLFAAVMGETGATSRTRTRRRCTSVRTTIRRPETSGTRPKSCSWMRTDSARTMMRRTRPNSKRGLPRSAFVRCSMKAFR
ncbi:MAG: UvrD-helicase domain-containing protein [Butyricicoccus sp.]